MYRTGHIKAQGSHAETFAFCQQGCICQVQWPSGQTKVILIWAEMVQALYSPLMSHCILAVMEGCGQGEAILPGWDWQVEALYQ